MFDLLVLFCAGVVLGAAITTVPRLVRTSFGELKIDCSDPDKDLYSIEVGDLDELAKKKRVILKVVKTATFSQK